MFLHPVYRTRAVRQHEVSVVGWEELGRQVTESLHPVSSEEKVDWRVAR